MSASHQDLVRAMAHDKGNVPTSLKGLAAKGLVTITRTPGDKAQAVGLTPAGRVRAEVVNRRRGHLIRLRIVLDDETFHALEGV
jgi:hypothetical protein